MQLRFFVKRQILQKISAEVACSHLFFSLCFFIIFDEADQQLLVEVHEINSIDV